MDPRFIELMRSARVPIQLNVQSGEEVLVIADTQTEPLVWQAMAAAAIEMGARASVAIIPQQEFHYADPPRSIIEAMKTANVSVFVTTKGLVHSMAAMEARKAGARFICCEEATVEILKSGGTMEDNDKMEAFGKGLEEKMNAGKRARLTSAAGTDFTCSIEDRTAILVVSRIKPPRRGCSFPGGEVVVAPVEGSCEGTVVWDVSMHHIGLISEPIVATFRDGRMVKVEGGTEARKLRDYLDRHGDENATIPAELAFGLHPTVPITGLARTDKKALGTCHVAIGMSADIGGQNTSKIHLDGVLRQPTLEVDGELIIDKGSFKV